MSDKNLYNIWGKVPVTYYQQGNFLQKIWHGIKINTTNKILKQINFKRCLDVGCASGYTISKIAKVFPNHEYFGVDIYDKAISFAKQSYPQISFHKASADHLPFKNEYFDLILCYETIEHVEDPSNVLKEIRRVLSKRGVFILAMDSGNSLFRLIWYFWEKTTGKVWQGAHLHPFHHTQLEKLIKQEKFNIQKKIFSHFGMEVVFILTK